MKNKAKEKNKNNIFIRIFGGDNDKNILNKIAGIKEYIFNSLSKSIRFELITTFGICFLISLGVYYLSNLSLREYVYINEIDYDYHSIENSARYILESIKKVNEEFEKKQSDLVENESIESNTSNIEDTTNKEENISLEEYIKLNMTEILNESDSFARVYITDLDGKILFSSGGEAADRVDIYSVLERMNTLRNSDDGEEITYLYPLNLNGERSYFLYSDRPTARINENEYMEEEKFLALVISVITFVLLFIIITNRKMKYIEEISKGLDIISKGDLSYRIDVRGKDEIAELANNINYMATEIDNRIQSERRAEQTKSELITNVSHDLRTPLTSVIGYLGLVKENKYENKDQMKDYLNIAFNKAERLKLLIDDLFEYTKLNNKGIKLEKTSVNLNEFLSQLIEEYVPMFEENEMYVERSLKAVESTVNIDSDKMVRVFENLLSNAIKYSYKPGIVMIDTYNDGDYIVTTVKNRGEIISKEKLERLFDRFYRGDEARNSSVSGTGLGLAISKNIVNLHDGFIWAESINDDIVFFIKLKLAKYQSSNKYT